ncbi:NitT/TauT family transport system substrate-binding protein [Desulfohalotomaculum tongense]|uniref:ABC transporter substrate-binding protein n=1 Tax=Desulforadius tongensis TaxID=1216062 RepID=UPI00195C04B4|nr:ABC transporter substrate-binding protein [Desulforadius tongensis]MBM7855954.1 NitT/TauT family transport system substrate-binding protein [Desulforadius tongensis]
MKRTIILLALLLTLTTAGCGFNQKAEVESLDKIIIQAPAAPPTAPLLKMIESKPFGEKTAVELIFYKSVDEAITRVVKKEADFTVLPVNVAAKLYSKGIDIKLANVSTWGILYLLSADESITGWADLKGKEIYVGAQGASPDIITRYLMEKNNLPVKDGTLKYASSPEIAQMMIQGLVKTAVLPEPLVTKVLSKNPAVKVIKSYHQEWQLVEGKDSSLPQAGMVVQKSFAENHPRALETIQQAYREALEQTVADPSAVSSLVENNFNIPAPFFEKAMARINLKFAAAQEAKEDVSNYLSKLLQFSPDMVGGKLPDEEFYLAE